MADDLKPLPRELEDSKGPYIVWEYWGYDGWLPTSFQTLGEALEHHTYTSTKVITRVVDWYPVENNDD